MPSRAPPACRDLQPELKQGFHTCQSGRDRTPQHGSRALVVKERALSQRRRLRHPGRVCCFLHAVKVRLWQQECASSNLTGTAERTRARACTRLGFTPRSKSNARHLPVCATENAVTFSRSVLASCFLLSVLRPCFY